MESFEWSLDKDSPNNSYTNFFKIFVDRYNESFPLKSKCNKSKQNDNPWCTREICKLIKKKCRLYKRFVKNPTSYRKEVYRKCRNKVTNMIKVAKKEYYEKKFTDNHGNSKKTWDVINSVLGEKSNKKTNIKSIKCNNKIVTDKNEICNSLNSFFANVGHDINATFEDCNDSDFLQYVDNVEETAFFKPITSKEIIDIVNTFTNNTSAEYDDIDIRIVKRAIHLICKHLSAIFNQCMKSGVFPESMKIARVVPIFKSGSPEIMTNYRAISVLSVFSKIFEKFISKRRLEFLKKCNIIKNNQYGLEWGTPHLLH